MTEIDHTHDAAATSWLASANSGSDFPLQNLPFSSFRRRGSGDVFRGGVAIGDQIVDLALLHESGLLRGPAAAATRAASGSQLNDFFEMGRPAWKAVRHALFDLLHSQAGEHEQSRRGVSLCLVPQEDAEYQVPARIGDYTDFYTSIDHATNVTRLFRPGEPLASNFRWVPLGYHGRVSSIGVSGQSVRRPLGQTLPAGAAEPVFGPCASLDYELELGVFIGLGNPQGESLALSQAEDHVFGLCLLNDWSARDIQRWESNPLGPFLAKNFATTISPWIVTLEALAPFRLPWTRADGEPQPLAYLDAPATRQSGALDVRLEVWLQSSAQRANGSNGQRLSATSFMHQYWTFGQMVAHHTSGGCNLNAGDLIGTGTVSGPTASEAGALIELSEGGARPVVLGNGESRAFLEDGDAITLKGWCEKPGFARIGFGESRGTVVPAHSVQGRTQ